MEALSPRLFGEFVQDVAVRGHQHLGNGLFESRVQLRLPGPEAGGVGEVPFAVVRVGAVGALQVLLGGDDPV